MKENDFNGWFGDSVVVNRDGKPLPVYHGTISTFTQFRTEPEECTSWYGLGESILGASFSESRAVAASYPPSIPIDAERKIITAYLRITHPKKYRSLNALRNTFIKFIQDNGLSFGTTSGKHNAAMYRKHLEEQGYDGITFVEGLSHDTVKVKARAWMAFYPEQIRIVKNK